MPDGENERAKAICAVCPVASQCLSYALAIGAAGIYGGLDEKERMLLFQPGVMAEGAVTVDWYSSEEMEEYSRDEDDYLPTLVSGLVTLILTESPEHPTPGTSDQRSPDECWDLLSRTYDPCPPSQLR